MRCTPFFAALAACAVTAAPASADQQITASFNKRYDNPNVTIAQGERLTFRNNDLVAHDVTSEIPGQFATPLIDQGQTAFVDGSQHLTTGTYKYVCSIHAEMVGTLTVSSAGQPVPRPGTGGPAPADTAPPVFSLKAPATRASALSKSGKLKFSVTSNEASTLKLRAKLGSTTAGTLTSELTAAAGQAFTVRLSAKVRRKLKKGSRLKLTATATDTAGNRGSATLIVKLR